ncbi:MAG: L-threonylcarbamoyladenylate synthase [Verrucomicrobia bacterium]|nr:L-threonylcarbamoyladenylate synthase [Verrucomicrobiota bacterium]
MSPHSAARIYRGTGRNLSLLAAQLKRGELVAVPTETVYGLAANAFDTSACRKIFRAKGRPTRDPLIVHFHDLKELDAIAVANPAALKLARAFWPGPLTIVLPKRKTIPAIVSAGLPSVAVRMPAHPLFRRLLKLTGRPLAAPSANVFGYVSPTTAEHVRHGLGRKIRSILDGGPAQIGLESTIVDLRDPMQPRLLRPGAVTRAELERVLGQVVPLAGATGKKSGNPRAALVAPGTMKRHYSPQTPVVLHETMPPRRAEDEAWLFVAKPAGTRAANVFWLDARGELGGAARTLFAQLRRLDRGGFRKIHVELPCGPGLAEAIVDRLRRAAAK